jgi:hypothetical protein
VTTSADGSYSFAAVPFGHYRMTITAGGCYTTSTSDLVVNGDRTLDVTVTQHSDDYGYTCRIEQAGYRQGDTPLPLLGDDRATAVDLPFPFFFYGSQYTKAWVSTNGHINFLASVTGLLNTAIPSPGTPNAAIYPFWDDLVVRADSSIRTALVGAAPDRRFVVEWRNIGLYGSSSARITFAVVIAESGEITFHYADLSTKGREKGDSATVGIEDPTGTDATQYSVNQPVLVNGRAIVFTPPAP